MCMIAYIIYQTSIWYAVKLTLPVKDVQHIEVDFF